MQTLLIRIVSVLVLLAGFGISMITGKDTYVIYTAAIVICYILCNILEELKK